MFVQQTVGEVIRVSSADVSTVGPSSERIQSKLGRQSEKRKLKDLTKTNRWSWKSSAFFAFPPKPSKQY